MKKIIYLLIISIMIPLLPGYALAEGETGTVNQSDETAKIVRKLTFSGCAESKEADKNVTLAVFQGTELPENLNPMNAVLWNQEKTVEGGFFSFKVKLANDNFVVYMKVEGEENPIIEYVEKTNYILYEDFEGYEGGTKTDSDLALKTTSGKYTKETDEDGNVYMGIDPNKTITRMYKYFGTELKEGRYKVDFRFKTTDLAVSDTYLRFMMGDSSKYNKGEYMMNTIRMDKGAYRYYYQAVDTTSIKNLGNTYEAGKWSDVSVWIDLDKNTVFYFIDGKFIQKSMFNARCPITGLSFTWNNTEGSKFCMDDLSVKKVEYNDVLTQYEKDENMPEELMTDVVFNVTSANTGNIFYEGEDVKLNINAENLDREEKNIKLNLKIYDYNGSLVDTQSKSINIESHKKTSVEFMPGELKFGTYKLEITDDEGKYSEFADFSYSRESKKLSSRYGTNVHMHFRRGSAEKLMPLIEKAGFGMTRDQFYWNETTTGEHNHSALGDNFNEYYNESIEMNMDMMGIIGLTNSKYSESEETLLAALEAYAEKFAAYYKDTVKYIELGNEYNNWSDSSHTSRKMDAKTYYKRMKAAYKGIKKGNPEAVVVGFATATIDLYYIEDVIECCIEDAKAGEKTFYPFDAVSVHCYHTSYILEKAIKRTGYGEPIKETPSTWYRYSMTLKEMLEKYDLSDMPIYGTELGWHTGSTEYNSQNKTGIEQAELYIRNLALNDGYDLFDKLIFYDFQDDDGDTSMSAKHWGIIESFGDVETTYAAKPAYIAVANYNSLLADAECVEFDTTGTKDEYKTSWFGWSKEYIGRLGTYKAKYKRAEDNADIYLLWDTEGTKTYTLSRLDGKSQVNVYDIFGNSEVLSVTDGKVNVTIGTAPVYVEVINELAEVLVNGDKSYPERLTVGDVITVKLNDSENQNLNVFVAAYKDDRLVSVVNDSSWTVKEAGLNVKVMVWDENQTPKINAIEIGQ